jgi:hypothetical protein
MGLLVSLPIARYELRFHSEEELELNGYTGSAWRGLFGHALKKTVCITRVPRCQDCMLYRSCVYPYIFETPVPAGSQQLRNYESIPHPFLLEVPWAARHSLKTPGHETSLRLTLFGFANRYLAYVVHAFSEGVQQGIQHSPPLALSNVLQEPALGAPDWSLISDESNLLTPLPVMNPTAPPRPGRIRIHFETPLRLRHQDRYLTPDLFHFSDLFRNLLGRLSSLKLFHTEQPLETDFPRLVSESKLVPFADSSLRWTDWTRYSSRQKQKLKMGGLIGHVDLDLTALEELWPYLWLGQYIHAGKGTSMGLGKLRIEEVA